MSYKYETHLHTEEASLCARGSGAEIARFYKKLGYQGVVITDHFFNGNTAIDRSLPWVEKVERYCLGYEHAKEEGDRIGLDVYFGIEWNYHGDEFLLYGVSKEWLLQYPDMLEWSHKRLFEEINRINGLMIQAHPFRDRDYVQMIHLYPQLVHGIEVTNAANRPTDDRLAFVYAKYFNLAVTSGSDTHGASEARRGIRGIISEECWQGIETYIRQVKQRSGYTIITTEDASGLQSEDIIQKPIEMRDAQENDITVQLKQMFPAKVLPF